MWRSDWTYLVSPAAVMKEDLQACWDQEDGTTTTTWLGHTDQDRAAPTARLVELRRL